LANFLAAQGHDVVLLKGYYSTAPDQIAGPTVNIFSTSEDLAAQLRREESTGIAAVFHCAAVSDFRFGRIWERQPDESLREVKSPKISTRGGPLLAELVSTEKLIRRLRPLFPKALIVGWKYELTGGREDVINQARQQIRENQTDACVANGAAYGPGFGLVCQIGQPVHSPDRDTLFRSLIDLLGRGIATSGR